MKPSLASWAGVSHNVGRSARRAATVLAILTVALVASGCGLPHEKQYAATDPSKVGTLTGGYGLRVGTRIAEANVLDTAGNPVALTRVRADKPRLIVFYRGGWCPPCNYQIHELSTHAKEFESRGVSIIAISVDKPQYAAATSREYGIGFPVLSDPDLAAHRAFNVVDHIGGMTTFLIARMGADLEARSGRDHHDVAIPAVFLVDATGTIRWAHADPDYDKRPSLPELLGAIDRSGIVTKE